MLFTFSKMPNSRVLSIQSTVVYGAVGNCMARPLLQSMGFEVDCVSTVDLVVHSGYPSRYSKGHKKTAGMVSSDQEPIHILKSIFFVFLLLWSSYSINPVFR